MQPEAQVFAVVDGLVEQLRDVVVEQGVDHVLAADNARAATRLGAEVGIREVHGGLLPQDKVDTVGALQAGGQRVLLVATA